MGEITAMHAAPGGTTMTIACATVRDGLALGDSVCVEGACLTITQLAGEGFSVEISPETLRRTSLGERAVGERVNLEQAVAVGGRLGGHYVQGHVDGVGQILERSPDGQAMALKISAPGRLMPYVVEKGFIALDGTSLTVTGRGDGWFSIMLIPFTQQAITLASKPIGAAVNLEVDIVAKYVESLLEGRFERTRESG